MLEQMRNREMTIGEMFSLSFQLFAKNLIHILWITTFLIMPFELLRSIIAPNVYYNLNILEQDLAISLAKALPTLKSISIYLLAVTLIDIFFTPIGIVSVAKLAQNDMIGKEATLKQAVLQTIEKAPAIILGATLYHVSLLLWSMVFIFPAIYFAVLWIFYLYSIGLSDKKGMEALPYSRSLVAGKWWRTFGRAALLIIAVSLAQYGIEAIFLTEDESLILSIISLFFTSVSQCYTYIFVAIWYTNRDCMKNPEQYEKYKNQEVLPENLV
ncbi:MAG: hypothetical protein GX299_00240 [Epulopiscium sp.]|nr:hypothetical protein [Candidatus Epulonipiscium sp.]